MDKKPTDEKTVDTTDVPETGTTEEEAEADESSSSQDDYEALIEAERKPDPEKAKEAFKKRQEKRQEEHEEEEVDEDKPMTRREMDAYLARKTHEIVSQSQSERITEIVKEMAESEGEARFIVEIHKNRVFPEGMTLRDQLKEAHYIASGKRLAAKNVELARRVQSRETASKDTSSGVPETASSEPKISADLKASLKTAGFAYDNTLKTYIKTLPNGRKLFRDPKTGRSGML